MGTSSAQGSAGMLNLDTHILIYFVRGSLTEKEKEVVLSEDLAISDIVLWEMAKLVQLGRLTFDLQHRRFLALLSQLQIFPITLEISTGEWKDPPWLAAA